MRLRRTPPRQGWRWADKRTLLMGMAALGTVGAVATAEFGRLWRKRSADEKEEAQGQLSSGIAAMSDTVAVAREGYREISTAQTAAFNLMSSFVISFGTVRLTTYAIREGIPPFRNVSISGRHIHHFVPGLALAFASGAAALLVDDEKTRPYLAIPLGIGMGLVFDESAMLLELQDVYWTRQGLLSVQLTLATATLLAATAYAIKIIRRGEARVLDNPNQQRLPHLYVAGEEDEEAA